jgi:hypothetical protein
MKSTSRSDDFSSLFGAAETSSQGPLIDQEDAIDNTAINCGMSLAHRIFDEEAKVSVAQKFMIDDWIRKSIISKIKAIPATQFKKAFFDICYITTLGEILEMISELSEIPKIEFRRSPHYVVLSSMHCMDFNEMDDDVVAGIPRAMLYAIGLDEVRCEELLGIGSWSDITAHYAKIDPISVLADKAKTETELNEGDDFEETASSSWWWRWATAKE